MKLGLIGKPLSHSFSPSYFAEKFQAEKLNQYSYTAFELESIKELPKLLQHPDIKGLNVTAPFKKEVIPYTHELRGAAKQLGAVNTLALENNQWVGYNTDVIGFEKSLLPLLNKDQEIKALVLGTGGSSQAVQWVLKKLHLPFQLVSRSVKKEQLSYADLTPDFLEKHKLIINTTPLGTWPKIEESPVQSLEGISDAHLCYDLIYNPEKTRFLELAQERGAQIKNGLEMLQIQAEESFAIWNASKDQSFSNSQ